MEWNPPKPNSPRGWYHRGRIQHFDPGEVYQFTTFILHDAIPGHAIARWKRQIDPNDPQSAAEYREKIERFLDEGHGSCVLRLQPVAAMVRDALRYHDGKKYELVAWVVMPNHVHLLLIPLPKVSLERVMHSIKSYTAHEANKIIDRTGQFWQHESFDRYIRNRRHFANVVRYIEMNPVKAGLCKQVGEWEFSSAYRVEG